MATIPENKDQRIYEMKQEALLTDLVTIYSDDIPFLKKVNRTTYGLFSGIEE